MSKSGLFAHFGSKQELQLATMETASAIFTEHYADYLQLGIEEWKKSYVEHEALGKMKLKLTPFHGHLIVLAEGVLSEQTAYPQAALSGAIS
jgi:AcrR family transcriptional regulator